MKKTFLILTGLIFTAVFVLHILRLVYSWPVTMGTYAVPIWFSYVGVVVSGLLAIGGFSLSRE